MEESDLILRIKVKPKNSFKFDNYSSLLEWKDNKNFLKRVHLFEETGFNGERAVVT